MKPHDFAIKIRVYVEDTDAGGVVYHANYLRFLERARSDWLRSLGVTQQQLHQQAMAFVVTQCRLNYRLPARLDDELDVTVTVLHRTRVSVTFLQQVCRGTELLCDAEVKVASVSMNSYRPTRLPRVISGPATAEKKQNGNR